MKKLSLLKVGLTVVLSAVLLAVIVGCSSNSSSSGDTQYTGGVAATVNGTEIPEDEVTEQIMSVREQVGGDDETWATQLNQYGYTVESFRESVIESLINNELIMQEAEKQGISIDPSEVDSYVNTMKSYYDSEDAFNEALEATGMSEEEYRTVIEDNLIRQKVQESFATDEEPSDEEVLESAKMYVPMYSGAKKSSHILFDAADEATAQEVLEKLQNGELDFAEAAKQYSKDTGSAENGGDVGWDAMSSFVGEYQTALNDLEKDEMSGLVTSTYGIHIIKCTDVFEAPEEITSLDQVPVEFLDSIKAMLKQSAQTTAYQDWLTKAREEADVVINPMPEGLPYYVDISLYVTEDEGEGDGTEGDATEGETDSPDATASAGADGAGEGEESTDAATASEGQTDAGDAETNADTTSQQPAEVTD